MFPWESTATCCPAEAPGELEIFRGSVKTTCACGVGVTVREAVWVTPPEDAEMVAKSGCATGLVKTVKDTLLANGGTETDEKGETLTTLSLPDSDTLAPPAEAGTFKVTVPVLGFPPVTLAGFSVRAATLGGSRVRDPAWLWPA